jgi:hypothetical protein
MGIVERIGIEDLQIRLAALDEAGADRRRGAEEIGHDPPDALQIADHPHLGLGAKVHGIARVPLQRLVQLPETVGKREIEVQARDHLHGAAIPVAEPSPIDRLHGRGVRCPVIGQRDAGTALEHAGHAGRPDQLLAEMAIDIGMDVDQEAQHLVHVRRRRCDELQERFGEVGRDVRMRQGGAERRRMRRGGEMTGCGGTESLFLQADAVAEKLFGCTGRAQPLDARFKILSRLIQ